MSWTADLYRLRHAGAMPKRYVIHKEHPGESDGWWWRGVYEALNRQTADGTPLSELIIYWWTPVANRVTREAVLDTFFACVSVNSDVPVPEVERASVEERIQVMVYTDQSPPVFLATP